MNKLKKISLVVVATLFFAAMMSSCHRETCPTYQMQNEVETTEHNC